MVIFLRKVESAFIQARNHQLLVFQFQSPIRPIPAGLQSTNTPANFTQRLSVNYQNNTNKPSDTLKATKPEKLRLKGKIKTQNGRELCEILTSVASLSRRLAKFSGLSR